MICGKDIDMLQHWIGCWLVAWWAPSHYLNQCWHIIIKHQETYFNDILLTIQTFSFKKIIKKCLFKRAVIFFQASVLSSLLVNSEVLIHGMSAAGLFCHLLGATRQCLWNDHIEPPVLLSISQARGCSNHQGWTGAPGLLQRYCISIRYIRGLWH